MNIIKNILPFVATIIVTVLVIYLTPIKNLNVIEPKPRDIDPKEFYDKYIQNKDKYVFIDVRPKDAYYKMHAAGSINIELYQMYDERHNLPKRGKEIVLICSGGRASGVAFAYLEHYGFLNLWRIGGGIENWVAQGLPVVTNSSSPNAQSALSSGGVLSSAIIPCDA